MIWVEYIVILLFVVLLAFSVYMLFDFYVCDNGKCRAFRLALDAGPMYSREYLITLLYELYNDGIWPLSFIGSAIFSTLIIWFSHIPFTLDLYIIVFLTGFITMYSLFSFMGHHYVRPIAEKIINAISQQPDVCFTDLAAQPKSPL